MSDEDDLEAANDKTADAAEAKPPEAKSTEAKSTEAKPTEAETTEAADAAADSKAADEAAADAPAKLTEDEATEDKLAAAPPDDDAAHLPANDKDEPRAPAPHEGAAPQDIVAFWRAAGPKRWFAHDDVLDAEIRARFEALHHAAARGELDDWADEPESALALLLLLDQFPRNLYRGSAHAFATDPLARQIAGRAVERGFDMSVPDDMRVFFYLPFEHSEDARDQDYAVALLAATGDGDLLHWAELHADIIARFGRFPHRNACLGRVSTDAEHRFLADGGFGG